MPEVHAFRSQNDTLVQTATSIRKSLKDKVLQDSGAFSLQALKFLARQLQKLQLHKLSELYTPLSRDANSEVGIRSLHFMRELDTITRVLKGHLKRWPNTNSVGRDRTVFIQETSLVLEMLEERVWRENMLLLNYEVPPISAVSVL